MVAPLPEMLSEALAASVTVSPLATAMVMPLPFTVAVEFVPKVTVSPLAALIVLPVPLTVTSQPSEPYDPPAAPTMVIVSPDAVRVLPVAALIVLPLPVTVSVATVVEASTVIGALSLFRSRNGAPLSRGEVVVPLCR